MDTDGARLKSGCLNDGSAGRPLPQLYEGVPSVRAYRHTILRVRGMPSVAQLPNTAFRTSHSMHVRALVLYTKTGYWRHPAPVFSSDAGVKSPENVMLSTNGRWELEYRTAEIRG